MPIDMINAASQVGSNPLVTISPIIVELIKAVTSNCIKNLVT